MSTNTFQPLAVTIPVAAQLLQLSTRSVLTLIEEGQLASVKFGGARRVPVSALHKLAENGASLPTVAERTAKVQAKRQARAAKQEAAA